jgi:predicted nucleic acid-binding protein
VIVADTNLIAYLLIDGPRTSLAEAVHGKDPAWSAPLLWRSEFRNVLASYLRRGEMSVASAIEHMDAAEAVMGGNEFGVESPTVLALAQSSRCSAYDCEFVQVALALNVPLVTSDARLLAAFPHAAVAPADFVG